MKKGMVVVQLRGCSTAGKCVSKNTYCTGGGFGDDENLEDAGEGKNQDEGRNIKAVHLGRTKRETL